MRRKKPKLIVKNQEKHIMVTQDKKRQGEEQSEASIVIEGEGIKKEKVTAR